MKLENLIILICFCLCKMELLEVRGKSTRKLRKVFILYSLVMTKTVDHLLATRFHAGVALPNKYVFSRNNLLTHRWLHSYEAGYLYFPRVIKPTLHNNQTIKIVPCNVNNSRKSYILLKF